MEEGQDLYALLSIEIKIVDNRRGEPLRLALTGTLDHTEALNATEPAHPQERAPWHHESLRYVQLAATDAAVIRGTAAVGRALREARTQAAIGNADEARAALTAATEAREQAQPDELDEIGEQITLSTPDGLFVAADALSLLPDPAAAEQAANFAVSAFDDIPANQAKFGNAACARIILSLARFRQGDVDGARDALRPVLDLPPQQRLYGIMTNMQRVQVTLTDARYHGSPTARDTAAEIEAFAQLSARTALPE